jgi:hypothetical protein
MSTGNRATSETYDPGADGIRDLLEHDNEDVRIAAAAVLRACYDEEVSP